MLLAPSRWRGFGVLPGWAWPRRGGPPWLDTAPAYVPGTRSGTLLGWLAVGTARCPRCRGGLAEEMPGRQLDIGQGSVDLAWRPWHDRSWLKSRSESDTDALARWRAARLAAVRSCAVREWGKPKDKRFFVMAGAERWPSLLRSDRDAGRKRYGRRWRPRRFPSSLVSWSRRSRSVDPVRRLPSPGPMAPKRFRRRPRTSRSRTLPASPDAHFRPRGLCARRLDGRSVEHRSACPGRRSRPDRHTPGNWSASRRIRPTEMCSAGPKRYSPGAQTGHIFSMAWVRC